MREIKFRAWGQFGDEKKDHMVENWENSFYMEYTGFNGGGSFFLMQYTGLKDKNGKEIYEGDIIEDHYWNSLWFTKKITVGIPDIYTWLGGHISEKGSYYKIIGNIYENPELL